VIALPPRVAEHVRVSLIRAFLAAAAAAVLAACSSSGTGLMAEGRGTVGSARVSFEPSRPELRPSDPHAGSAFELGISRVSGSATQELLPGQSSTVGTQTFNGPASLTNEAEIVAVDMLGRWRFFPQNNSTFGIEFTFGLSYIDMGYTTRAPGQRGSDSVGGLGGTVGVGGIIRLRQGTSVQARHTWFTTPGIFTSTDARRLEVSLVQALGRNVSLRAGYASWQVTTDENTGSTLNARFTGPALGLELGF
jgi:hypothetical protein